MAGVAIIACAAPAQLPAQSMTNNLSPVLVTWDPRPAAEEVIGYRLWESNVSGIFLVSFTPTNGLIYTNYDAALSHWLACTPTNNTWEASRTNWQRIPPRPRDAGPLRLVPLSLLIPVPGDAEISTDLVNWRERIHLEPDPAGVRLTMWTLPTEPALFLRPRPEFVWAPVVQ